MDIKVELPPGPRQREFLDYLNSSLRERMGSFGGSSGVAENGNFETAVAGKTKLDSGEVDLIWKVTIRPDGMLDRVSVFPSQAGDSDTEWKISAHELISSVLSSVISERKKKYFKRNFFFYIGEQLDGEYWLPGFRFAPAYPNDPNPHLMNAERIISIDQEIEAIDDMHATSIAEESARRHASRMSLLLNTALYQPDNAHRWVIKNPEDGSGLTSERLQLGFAIKETNLGKMPKKSSVCQLGKYEGRLSAQYRVMGELMSLPPETRKILRGIDSAEPKIREAFDRGARLYQVAATCGRSFPSVGLAYRVAAVEAICKTEDPGGNFSAFMRKHVRSYSDIDDLLNYLYGSVRSAHFHSGEFPNGEFSRTYYFDPLMDAENTHRDAIHRACFQITREAIIRWIVSLLPDDTLVSGSE